MWEPTTALNKSEYSVLEAAHPSVIPRSAEGRQGIPLRAEAGLIQSNETPRFSRGDIEKYPHIGLTSGRFSLQLFDILLAESEIGGVGMVENHRRNR